MYFPFNFWKTLNEIIIHSAKIHGVSTVPGSPLSWFEVASLGRFVQLDTVISSGFAPQYEGGPALPVPPAHPGTPFL